MTQTNNIKILLAEDNPVNQKVAYELLKEKGYNVEVASNGKEVFDQWKQKTFDLILMDIQMPEMSGYEATQLIRSEESDSGKHIPIIAVTAHAMKGDRDKCIHAGMDDYISKPISPNILYEVIEKYYPKNEKIINKNSKCFNLERVMDRLGANHELFRTICEIFLKDSRQIVEKLEPAIKQNNAKEIEFLAHSLKSSIGNFEATKAYELAYAIEKEAIDNNFNRIEILFNELKEELKNLWGDLESSSSQP